MSQSKSGLSQKEYLQIYLKKHKKKKPKSLESRSRKNVKIIDDDEYQFGPNDNYYGEEDEEDAPVVAAIIDERPREISQMERYQMSGNWKQLDGASPPLAMASRIDSSPSRKRSASGKHKRGHKRDILMDDPVEGSFKGSKASHRHEGPLIDDDGRRYRDSVSPSRDFQVDKEERRHRREGRAESPRYREGTRNGGDRRSPIVEQYRYESRSSVEQRYRDRRTSPDDSRYQEPRMRASRQEVMPERRYHREESPRRSRHTEAPDESPRRSRHMEASIERGRHHWTESTEVDPPSPAPKERKRDFGFLTRKPVDQMREKRRSESPPEYNNRSREDRDYRDRDDRKRQSDELQRDRSSSRRRDDRGDKRGRRKEPSPDRHSKIKGKSRFDASSESVAVSRKHDQRWREDASAEKPFRSRKHEDRDCETTTADRDSRPRKRREETSPDRGSRSSRHDERRRDVHADVRYSSNEYDDRRTVADDGRRRDSSPRPIHSNKHDVRRKDASPQHSSHSGKHERKQRDGSVADRHARSKPDERRRGDDADQPSHASKYEERRRKITPPPSRSSKYDRKWKDNSPSPPASKNRQRDNSPESVVSHERNRHKVDAELSSRNETGRHSLKNKPRENKSKESPHRKHEDNGLAAADRKEHRRKKDKDDVDSPPPPPKRRRDDADNEHREKSSKFSEYGLVNSKSKNYETQEKQTDEGMGRNAATIYRDRKTGKIRDFETEKLEKIEKRRKEDEKMKQYHEWGKGLKQVEDEKMKKAADAYEMTKPLARYADDDDLEEHLKQKEIEGLDPMLEYINAKKKKKQSKDGIVTKTYKGSYPMNRFNIRPGHRWDGVDRSNGFEQEWFTKQNERKARQEEAYKWSSADM